MRLSAPRKPIWTVSVVAGCLGLVGGLGVVPLLAPYAFWLLALAFVLLTLATLFKGL
ncbi:MAG TPA: hypothetical protein VGE98_15345 [Thermoanaerobaculia bacterium]